jgi:PAS domain S-box-containing protein
MVMSTSVLLVEDNPADAYLLIDMLQTSQQQWHVTQAKNLHLALESLHNSSFAVILLDLSLPDSKGLNTFTQLHAFAQDSPIIVLTGTDDQELALHAVAEGAQDYLVKGKIAPEGLVQAIYHAIERGRILKQLQQEVLERQRSEQTLRLIVEGTASVTGKDFFRSLVHSLAEALNVRYAFISECVDSPPTRVRAFAFWNGDRFGENFEYRLSGTPCELVLNRDGYLYCSNQVQSLFSKDLHLAQLQAQSYAGIALINSANKLLGHLAVLDDEPMENESRHQAILEIFAARAAAEMERLQMEEALRLSEDKFSKAFRSSPNAITISTLKDGRYIEVNESCLQMLGYNREDMIGRSAIELGVWPKPEDRSRMMELLQQQETISNLELELCKKSGAMLQGLLSAEIIHLENEPCLLAVTTDITALKQAEKALERLAEVGELASMIVHEVRNPLTTVLMGLNSFKKLSLSERFQEYLALALDEAERLQRLLNQILLYAKPQTLQCTELELNNLIIEMLLSLQNMPAASRRQLEFCPNSTSVRVLADKDKLKQVLINLVTNAFEAVADEEIVTLRIQEEVNQVCLQVHNGGEPIPPKVLSQLTKPFYTTKSTGNGLGLAIVKRIVEAHGGELNLKSSVDTGTCVTVRLPIKFPENRSPLPSHDQD